ncbi:MAG TPA: NAD(P)-dependent alcohol dehydrogenase [Myxococcales bacterium]|nr:NAD(P)-dependent alcohol dehydrogenase [Myxococcales bacterium]
MLEARGWAAFDSRSPMRPFPIQRREPGGRDVLIDILFCGICHSDLHQVRNEWAGTKYPIVAGHEIVGRAAKVGAAVTKVKAGDTVGVGCFVGSCGQCEACRRGLENYCEKGAVATYNSVDADGQPTYGGYSNRIVVDEKFILRVQAKEKLESVAPLLCAGVTTWSPLRRWKVGKGHRVAVLGLGGLGHMAVKLAAALGAEVTLFSSSPSKEKDARRLGAHDFVATKDARKLGPRFDFILDTVSAPHDLNALAGTLRLDGTLIMLGASPEPMPLHPFALIMKRRSIAGSLVGGIPETQEVLDFCADKGIAADVETIAAKDIDRAYDRMLKGDVRYRFSIDASTI